MTAALQLDHLRYVSERNYRRALHLEIRRGQRKRWTMRMTVLHESDGTCCRRQAWSTTFAKLVEALGADQPGALGLVPGVRSAKQHDAAVDRVLGRSA